MIKKCSLKALQYQRLPRDFYNRSTVQVAQELLGKYLVKVTDGCMQVGRIVEVEAYLGPQDLAAHSSKGITPRTKTLFGPPGHAYVYLIYGMYHCLNTVTEGEGSGTGVLIRALEPLQAIELRTQGPGLLCRALGIDKTMNAHDLLSDNFFISEQAILPQKYIIKKPRVGVDYAGEIWANKLLRFYIKDNPFISRK